MEKRRKTTEGVLLWTPAPARTSPTSSVTSEDVWGDDELAEKDDDFVSQMDENGIIGLTEGLEDVRLEQSCGDEDAVCSRAWYPGRLTTEEADPGGSVVDTLLKELSEHLSRTETPEEDEQILSPCDDEEKDGEEEAERNPKTNRYRNGSAETYNDKEVTEISSMPSCSYQLPIVEPAQVSSNHCPVYPHLLHFTAEEIAATPGIDRETFPDMDFTESLSDSHSSVSSSKSSSHWQQKSEMGEPKELQPAAICPEPVKANQYSRVGKGPSKSSKQNDQPTASRRKRRQPSPEATCSPNTLSMSNTAEANESRGCLTYRTPNFSQVAPRVCFPKGGYKPPKSKHSGKRESLFHEPPSKFKSPADIVKEVLLYATDDPMGYNRPSTSALNSTALQEFKSCQEAIALVEQLQENYNRLLIKHTDAENTIDRLRLGAKVNMYSDPPKPGHSVLSGPSNEASKFLMIHFPQAQRAELNPTSLHPIGHSTPQRCSSARSSSSASISSSRSPDPQMGQQAATKILFSQANMFLQQLQTFENLPKGKKLKAFEEGVSQLLQGLDSLGRGFLLARAEFKALQQQGAEVCPFDPERELEGLIFQCGLRMDELKEQLEQTSQEPPAYEAPPSPSLQPTTSFVPSEGGSAQFHPQSRPVPLLVDPAGRGGEDETNLNSVYLRPLTGTQTCVERDFASPMDHYQMFKELPEVLDCSMGEGAPPSAALRTDIEPGHKGKGQETLGHGHMAKSDQQEPPPVPVRKQLGTKSNVLSGRDSSTLPVHPPCSSRKFLVGKSHSSSLSSLEEITASERRRSKLQSVSRRGLCQDGIISPETDSGFVGSESSRRTPAAATSYFHQRSLKSFPVPPEVNSGKPQPNAASAASPGSPPSHRHMTMEPSEPQRRTSKPKRTRQVERRCSSSSSSQHWVSRPDQTRTHSESTSTVSDDGQSDHYAESINSPHSFCPSSSLVARSHHGDSRSSSQVADCNGTIPTLQAGVTRLKDRPETSLRNKTPFSSLTAAPPFHKQYTHHYPSTPRISSRERCRDIHGGGREGWTCDESEEESVLRHITRKRPASARRQEPKPVFLFMEKLQVSRSTQTSAREPERQCSHTSTVCSRGTQAREVTSVSVQVSADEPDSRRGRAPSCPQCLSHHRGRSERPLGGGREPNRFSSSSRLRSEPTGNCEPGSDSPGQTSCKPAESPDKAARSRTFAAGPPPTLLHCLPVCPQPLLLYSSLRPVYVLPRNRTGKSSGVRGRMEVRERTSTSLSADEQSTLDRSLNKAIRAARQTKATSRHMVSTLTTGLHFQEQLSRSFSS